MPSELVARLPPPYTHNLGVTVYFLHNYPATFKGKRQFPPGNDVCG